MYGEGWVERFFVNGCGVFVGVDEDDWVDEWRLNGVCIIDECGVFVG